MEHDEDGGRARGNTFFSWLGAVFSVGTDLGVAGLFLITWIAPYTFDERMVHHLTFVMLLEFLVVHSTGFLGAIAARDVSRGKRVLQFGGLMLLYSLFAAAFSVSYGGPWPFIAFMGLLLSKFPGVVFHPEDDAGMNRVMANWAAMAALYLGTTFFTLVFPIPPLGITPDVIAKQEFDVGGEWPDQPFRVMAMGVLYFSGLAVVSLINEILAFRRRRRAAEAAVEAARDAARNAVSRPVPGGRSRPGFGG